MKNNLPNNFKFTYEQIVEVKKYMKKGYIFPNKKPDIADGNSIAMSNMFEYIIINEDGTETKITKKNKI